MFMSAFIAARFSGGKLLLGALEDLGVLSAPIAAALRGETDSHCQPSTLGSKAVT
jgi:hypothetical protein